MIFVPSALNATIKYNRLEIYHKYIIITQVTYLDLMPPSMNQHRVKR